MEFVYLMNTLVADSIPSTKAMLLQICVEMKAMPWYSALATILEFMVENGWSSCFPRITDVSSLANIMDVMVYIVIEEFRIY